MTSSGATVAQRRLSSIAVPDGWRLVGLGQVFWHVVDSGHRQDLPILSVTVDGRVIRRDSLERRTDRQVPLHRHLRVLPHDIVYNTMRMWQGASGLVREEGYVSPAYTVCRTHPDECPEFWKHYLRFPPTVRRLREHSQGFAKDRHRLYFQHFASVPAMRPPSEEQRKIAATLSSVDDAIEKTRAVIEQVQVVKKGLMQELLTRGLPGRHMQFKQTKIGEVPEDWDVVPLGDILEGIDAGWSPRCASEPAKPGEWGVLKVSSVSWGTFRAQENKRLLDGAKPRPEIVIAPGDLLLSRANTRELVARTVIVHLTPPRLMMSDKILRIHPNDKSTTAEFLHIVLSTERSRAQIEDRATGSSGSMKNLSQEKLRTVVVPLPSLDEQRTIGEVHRTISTRTTTEADTLARLKDLKASIMSVLLTGEVRVTPDSEVA